MIDRACISINNRCNLNCAYCHFHTPEKANFKAAEMDVYSVLDNIKRHIEKYAVNVFKLGFAGNGEPLLDYELLRGYIEYIGGYLKTGRISAYVITNGTLITKDMLEFFKKHNVSVGFSLDGLPEIHNKFRCNTHSAVMRAAELYRLVNGRCPPLNCTVGRDTLEKAEETVAFFESFNSRITFSRMIGPLGITLEEFHKFLETAKTRLDVRVGKYDCTMYGGKCGAGINNIFYANGNVYLCGNCVDLKPIAEASLPIDCIKPEIFEFDRNFCFRELQSKNKKFALYGLPCSGKTTLMDGLDMNVIHGSAKLNEMANGKFSELSENEKTELREKYAEELSKRDDSFISDGHYSFLENVVFTEADGELYDVFLYLYCEPEIIEKRLKSSHKNERFKALSAEQISRWQNFEIENLRRECHQRNKDFYVINNADFSDFQSFIEKIKRGFGSFALAGSIADRITEMYPEPCEIYIADGDKTIIKQDSFRVCGGFKTHAFDGNFYTGYQAMKFTEEIENTVLSADKLSEISLNRTVFDRISDKNYVVLSSGIPRLWDEISKRFGLKNVIANTQISADTKFFTVKILQSMGYKITALGDSKIDYYMLKKADKGYLCIGESLSRSLEDVDLSGLDVIYAPYIMADERDDIAGEIAICRSNSGVNGAPLANAHLRLGKMLGEAMKAQIPQNDSAVIVLERGGRFFGDGVYAGFGGTFYSFDPKNGEFPSIPQKTAVIVDSVVNTGKTVLCVIEKLKRKNPEIEIVTAANVIQENAVKLLQRYRIFAVRTSENSFIGSRQAVQLDGKGPDTADRLFNYI